MRTYVLTEIVTGVGVAVEIDCLDPFGECEGGIGTGTIWSTSDVTRDIRALECFVLTVVGW